MTLPDFINGLFEGIGGFFVWMNVRQIIKDKQVKGVYWPATLVFTAWGFWNLYYYPHLGQWMSFAGGLVIVSGNFAWVALVMYYAVLKRKNSSADKSPQIEIDWTAGGTREPEGSRVYAE